MLAEFSKGLAAIGVSAEKRVALAVSGGGDSMAMLHMAQAMFRRPVLALIVDHGLRPESAEEAALTRTRAKAMGANPMILSWQGIKPKTGLQKKARDARYHLMASACQEASISVLLTGHNQDDQAETIYMRNEAGLLGPGLAGIALRAPLPSWPRGAGIDVARPLLGFNRLALREHCREQGIPYIDDPSNNDTRFSRVRARAVLNSNPGLRGQMLAIGAQAAQERSAEIERAKTAAKLAEFTPWGGARVTGAAQSDLSVLLPLLIPCISGRDLSPPRQKTDALAGKINAPDFKGAALGGALIMPSSEGVIICRDPGAVLGRRGVQPLPPLAVCAHQSAFWDRRFAVRTERDGEILAYSALARHKRKPSAPLRAALKAAPNFARSTVPIFVGRDGTMSLPVTPLGGDSQRPLANERFCSYLRTVFAAGPARS